MMLKKIRHIFYLAPYIGALVCAYFALNDWNEYTKIKINAERLAIELAKANNLEIVNKIEEKFKNLQNRASVFEKKLSSGLEKEAILILLEQFLNENKELDGAGVSFIPEKKGIFSTYLTKNENSKIIKIPLENFYEYFNNNLEWYEGPLARNEAIWTEPFYEIATKSFLVGYAIPFYKKGFERIKENIEGIIHFNYSVKTIKNFINDLGAGKDGYAFVTSARGKYISHPIEEYVSLGKSIEEIYDLAINSSELSGALDLSKEKNIKEDSWIFYNTFESSKWKLWGLLPIGDINIDGLKLKSILIKILLKSLVSIILILSFLILLHYENLKFLWGVSIFSTFVFIGATLFIESLNYNLKYSKYNNNLKIKSVQNIENALKDALEKDNGLGNFNKILTGVNIKHIEIVENENTVTMSGYVWQKYPLNTQLTKGFDFPDLIRNWEMKEFHREIINNHEVIVWSFNVTLYQEFNYTQYPFDNKVIEIRLSPKDMKEHVVLIPDLNEYDSLAPTALPGIKRDVITQGWEKQISYFTFNRSKEKVWVGTETYIRKSSYPELALEIVFRRYLSSTFIGNVLPILVMLFTLFFALIMLKEKNDNIKDDAAPSSFDFLSISSGLFFAIVLSHVELRKSLAIKEVIYLEYLYFLIYITIMWVIINSYIFKSNLSLPILKYKDNLISKIIFWPLLSFTFFIITLVILR